jgi:hypothetical protein
MYPVWPVFLSLIIAAFGFLIIVVMSWRLPGGFGPHNLRAVGLVFVGTLAALLGLRDDAGSATAAMGILGVIAGYLLGIKDK